MKRAHREIEAIEEINGDSPTKFVVIVDFLNQVSKEEIKIIRKNELMMLAKEEAEVLIDEVKYFKRKCEMLHHKNFPSFFDEEGNLLPKESFMRLLAAIKEHFRGLGG